MEGDSFWIPDELDLVAFFGADPIERSVEDGYWCYEVVDTRGVHLRFSFNLFEQSIQTTLRVADSVLATVVHEGARTMRIEGDVLTCHFSYPGSKATLVLRVAGAIRVDWASLGTS